jgi:TonB family protein
MNTASHPFDPETIMSFLDGELTAAQSDAIRTHLSQCAECTAVSTKLQESTSALAKWSIVETPPSSSTQQQISIAIQRLQRRNSLPLASFFRVIKPRYILVAVTLVLVVTFWAQQSPSRIALPEREMRAKLKKESAQDPHYPDEARKKGIQGIVVLHLLVAKDGSVKKLDVVSGNSLLAKSSADTVHNWKFEKTLVNGKPVEVETTAKISFTIYP